MLYPVVFLFGHYVQTPLLMGRIGLPFWAALFIGNIAGVVLLNWLVPWSCRALDWWLNPRPREHGRLDLAGTALLIELYAICLGLFSWMS